MSYRENQIIHRKEKELPSLSPEQINIEASEFASVKLTWWQKNYTLPKKILETKKDLIQNYNKNDKVISVYISSYPVIIWNTILAFVDAGWEITYSLTIYDKISTKDNLEKFKNLFFSYGPNSTNVYLFSFVKPNSNEL